MKFELQHGKLKGYTIELASRFDGRIYRAIEQIKASNGDDYDMLLAFTLSLVDQAGENVEMDIDKALMVDFVDLAPLSEHMMQVAGQAYSERAEAIKKK